MKFYRQKTSLVSLRLIIIGATYHYSKEFSCVISIEIKYVLFNTLIMLIGKTAQKLFDGNSIEIFKKIFNLPKIYFSLKNYGLKFRR